MRIIGAMGLAQAGKTSLTDFLAEYCVLNNFTPRRLAFAGRLKEAAARMGASKKERPKLYRRVCVDLGTAFRDPSYLPGLTGPDWWVNLLEGELMTLQEEERMALYSHEGKETAILIDDVRYQNEVDLVHKWGGSLVMVDGSSRVNLEDELYLHTSEALAVSWLRGGWDLDGDTDWQISNVFGSLDEYKAYAFSIAPALLGEIV